MLVLVSDEEPAVQSKTPLWPCIWFPKTKFPNSFSMSNMWIQIWNPQEQGEALSILTWSWWSGLFRCETCEKDSSWQRNLKRHLEADHFNPASSVFNVNHVNTDLWPSRTWWGIQEVNMKNARCRRTFVMEMC